MKEITQTKWPADYQVQFWQQYPLKREKKFAFKSLDKVKKSGEVSWAVLISAVMRYSAECESENKAPKYIKQPATWLNKGCWDDEPHRSSNGNGHNGQSLGDLARDIADQVEQRELASGLNGSPSVVRGATSGRQPR